MKLIKKINYILILFMLFGRALIIDSFDAFLKVKYGIAFGSYFIHPFDIILFLLGVMYLFKNFFKIPKNYKLIIFFLFSSLFLDLFMNQEKLLMENIITSYLKILSVVLIIPYIFSNKKYIKWFLIALFLTFNFIGLQHLIFSFYPIKSWIHEIIYIGSIKFYRTLTTSGPATSGGYVMIISLVLFTEIIKSYPIFKYSKKYDYLGFLYSFVNFTRGVIIIYTFNFLYKKIKDNKKTLYFWFSIILITMVLSIVIPMFFDSRATSGYGQSGDFKRFEQFNSALDYFFNNNNYLFGKGYGMLYSREFQNIYNNRINFEFSATHNLNILLLNEFGMIRFVIIYIFLFKIIFKYFKENKILSIFLLFVVLILFNTETNLVFSEYNFSFFLLIGYLIYYSKLKE